MNANYILRSLLFMLIMLCSFSSFTQSMGQKDIINVPADYLTIQEGIDAAEDGDTVLVDHGVYLENINFNGKGITLASNYLINQDPSSIQMTIIDGSNPVIADTASCVLFINGEDSTSILCGFTLTGGTGTVWDDEHNPGALYTEGGGILIQQASPVIKHNIIEDNVAVNNQGAIVSAGGGAIRCGDGNPYIHNNFIMSNEGRYGGGIVLNFSGAVIRNNIIAFNSGGEDFGGGGIWAAGDGVHPKIIENNTIAFNHSHTGGGGLRLWQATATLTNNIIWSNTAFSSPQIQGFGGVVTYSDVEGGWTGEGNIDEEPFFMEHNLELNPSSPCIDTGHPDPMYDDPEDPGNPGNALYPAQGTLRNDMGAYGGPLSMAFPSVITGIESPEDSGIDLHIFPVPASTTVWLRYQISDAKYLICDLFDISGTKIHELVHETQMSGEYEIQLDVKDLPDGLYIIRVQAGGVSTMTKLLIVH